MGRLRHLVVVVPGIGGSVLQTSRGVSVWNEQRRRLVAAASRPARLGLDESPDLVPVHLLPDISVVGPFVVPGYDRLVRKIRDEFDDVRVDISSPLSEPDPFADVVLFPYDFRHSIRDAAERLAADVSARLGGGLPSARRRRVVVVAHSMGGLVARYWLGPLGGAADCAALITLGTPHRGAPKALDILANGLRVGPARLKGLTEVLRQWPSVYELLPRYQTIERKQAAGARYPHETLHPHETPYPYETPHPQEALYPYELGALLPGIPSAFAPGAEAAFGVHRDIEDAWQGLLGTRDYPQVTAVFGRGHGTLQRSVLASDALKVSKDPVDLLPNPDWHGDGTVPAISAIPIEADEDRRGWRGTPERHMALASSDVVVDLLRSLSAETLLSVRGASPDKPWLGLDLDETVWAGEPAQVVVRLNGTDGDETDGMEGDPRVLVRVRPRPGSGAAPGAAVWRTGTRTGPGSWQAPVGPLAAGEYLVEVAATGVPGVGRLQVDEVLNVMGVDEVHAAEEGARG